MSIRWRPQLSIRALLLLIALICGGIWISVLSARVKRAEVELNQLRAIAGYLKVSDPSQIYATLLPSQEEYTWRWRIQLPQHRAFKWHFAYGDVPRGVPPPGTAEQSSNPIDMRNLEVVVMTATLRQTVENGWNFRMQTAGVSGGNPASMGTKISGGVGTDIPGKVLNWIGKVPSQGQVLGEHAMAEMDAGRPVIFLQLRAQEQQSAGNYLKTDAPTPGFVLWLE